MTLSTSLPLEAKKTGCTQESVDKAKASVKRGRFAIALSGDIYYEKARRSLAVAREGRAGMGPESIEAGDNVSGEERCGSEISVIV